MRFCGFLALAAIGMAPLPLLANGGSFSTSIVQRSGGLVPVTKESIFLEREERDIEIEADDEVRVRVSYEMVNRGPADTVTFGFPVDLANRDQLPTPNGYDYVLGNSFRGLHIRDNDKPVAVQRVVSEPLKNPPAGVDPAIKIVRRWSLLPVRFAIGERKHLTIEYRVRCFGIETRVRRWLGLANGPSQFLLHLSTRGHLGQWPSPKSGD